MFLVLGPSLFVKQVMFPSVEGAYHRFMSKYLEGFDGYLPSLPQYVYVPSGAFVVGTRLGKGSIVMEDLLELPFSFFDCIGVLDEVDKVVVGDNFFPHVAFIVSNKNLVFSIG
jgi:hypothetical protein